MAASVVFEDCNDDLLEMSVQLDVQLQEAN